MITKEPIIQYLPTCNIITLDSIIILITIFFQRLVQDDKEYFPKLLNIDEFSFGIYSIQTPFFLILSGSFLSISIIFALLFIIIECAILKQISVGVLFAALISLIIPMILLQYEVLKLLIKSRLQ